MDRENEPIAAISTAVSEAGIGIVRISGQGALDVADQIFRGGKNAGPPSSFTSHTIHYGYIYDQDEMIDEVLMSVFRGPKSYTTQDTVEINCHGGIFAVQRVLETVLSRGVRPADPGEFTKRAFLGGRMDLSSAEAVMDVIQAKNDFALRHSLRQLKGGLYRQVSAIRQEIIRELAVIESAIDDPEHYELCGYGDLLKERLIRWTSQLDRMILSYHDGKLLSQGIRTVIVGKPNVGKSSLLNLLAGDERAIVTDIEGTTRDLITENIRLGKLTLVLSDTAGIRKTSDVIEKIGVDRALKAAQDADLILCILDGSGQMEDEDIQILRQFRDKPKIVLINKNDLTQQMADQEVLEIAGEDVPVIHLSAKLGTGKQLLEEAVTKLFFQGKIEDRDDAVIVSERHRYLLEKCRSSLRLVGESIQNGLPEDFYSIDLTEAASFLGQITGEDTSEDVVNEIFRKFCMGK